MLKDSGTRTTFATGAVRDGATGKGRFDLLPYHALERVAQHFENGALKYEDRNWEKGIPTHKFADSALRHLTKYVNGGHRDEDHLAAAAWNTLCLMDTEERIRCGALPASLDTLVAGDSIYTAAPKADKYTTRPFYVTSDNNENAYGYVSSGTVSFVTREGENIGNPGNRTAEYLRNAIQNGWRQELTEAEAKSRCARYFADARSDRYVRFQDGKSMNVGGAGLTGFWSLAELTNPAIFREISYEEAQRFHAES